MGRYIRIDKDSGEILLRIPREAEEYRGELYTALQEEFMFDGLDAPSEERIDAFVAGWLQERGIALAETEAGGNEDGPATARPPAPGPERDPFA